MIEKEKRRGNNKNEKNLKKENRNRIEEIEFYKKGSSAPIFSGERKEIEKWRKLEYKKKNIFFVVKDNFWTKNILTTASSNFLSSFSPNDDATVIKLLKKKGYKLLGKTTLDEFACGSTGLFSNKGRIVNPYNSERIVGGSSSGSVFAVSDNLVSFSLGHDAGDSIRRPSSYCGVIGFKPSYGKISRYGIIPMASSFDTVGIISKEIKIIQKIFKILAKPDEKDLNTLLNLKKNRKIEKNKISIIKGIEKFLTEEYAKIYLEVINFFKINLNYEINEINIPKKIRDNIQITYIILCSSELVSHLNSLQGVTYGVKNLEKTIEEKRSEFIGKWVKERIILGAYFLEKNEIIEKAIQARNFIKKWMNKILLKTDFFIFPGTISSAPLIEDFQNKNIRISHWVDNLLLLANISGTPSINIPIGKEKEMPISINIDSYKGNDENLILFAKKIVKKLKINI